MTDAAPKEMTDAVRAAIVAIIRDIQCSRHFAVWDDARLVEDLHLDSDDLSFTFIPELERELQVTVPASEWLCVHTVRDVVGVFARFRPA